MIPLSELKKAASEGLAFLKQQEDVEVVGLLTTFNEAAGRVAMHAVRREFLFRVPGFVAMTPAAFGVDAALRWIAGRRSATPAETAT